MVDLASVDSSDRVVAIRVGDLLERVALAGTAAAYRERVVPGFRLTRQLDKPQLSAWWPAEPLPAPTWAPYVDDEDDA